MNRQDWIQAEFAYLEKPQVYDLPDPRRQL
jgi:hypothetical protein